MIAQLAAGGGDLDSARVAHRDRDVARLLDDAREAVDALVVGTLELEHVDRVERDHVDVAETSPEQLAQLPGDLVAAVDALHQRVFEGDAAPGPFDVIVTG